jgi:hypothetical protein
MAIINKRNFSHLNPSLLTTLYYHIKCIVGWGPGIDSVSFVEFWPDAVFHFAVSYSNSC